MKIHKCYSWFFFGFFFHNLEWSFICIAVPCGSISIKILVTATNLLSLNCCSCHNRVYSSDCNLVRLANSKLSNQLNWLKVTILISCFIAGDFSINLKQQRILNKKMAPPGYSVRWCFFPCRSSCYNKNKKACEVSTISFNQFYKWLAILEAYYD